MSAANLWVMPGRSRYQVDLTVEERQELKHRAGCYTLPYRQVQRARLVLHAADGLTNVEIARRLEMTPEAVGRWRKRFCEQRLEVLMTSRGRYACAVLPPEEVAAVKAVACELPASEGVPLSRFSRTELHSLVIERGVTEASASTIWRWLHYDALRPWQQRSWVFPRDPDFEAARVLDLYEGRWEGRLLHPGEFVISADEKTQLQALGRRHATLAPAPGRSMLVEHEYRRGGTLVYLAALDIGRRGTSARTRDLRALTCPSPARSRSDVWWNR